VIWLLRENLWWIVFSALAGSVAMHMLVLRRQPKGPPEADQTTGSAALVAAVDVPADTGTVLTGPWAADSHQPDVVEDDLTGRWVSIALDPQDDVPRDD
jgi:hypothetical protein